MTYGLDYNGGPYHRGICPECNEFNGDCTDGLCEDCYDMQPVKCSGCGEHYQPDQMHGSICQICYDNEQEEKAGILADVGSVWAADH